MAIQFTCPCGAQYSVDDSKAGILFHCDDCGLDIPVPAAGAGSQAPEGPATEAAAPAETLGADQAPAGPDAAVEPSVLAALLATENLAEMLPTAEIVEEAPAKPGEKVSAAALAQGIGAGNRAGAADLVAQMRAARAGGAGALVMSDLASAAPRPGLKRLAAPRPMTARERAAHHLGFKKVMWKPALGVGIICILFGLASAGCYFMAQVRPRSLPGAVPAGVGGKITKDEKGDDVFEDVRGDVKRRIVYGADGNAWFIDLDAADIKWEDGRPVGQVSGFDVLGTRAEENVDYLATVHVDKTVRRVSGAPIRNLVFTVAFLVVGLSLTGLALWMRRDVRLVEGTAETEKGELAEKPAPAASVAETAGAATPGAGGPAVADVPVDAGVALATVPGTLPASSAETAPSAPPAASPAAESAPPVQASGSPAAETAGEAAPAAPEPPKDP